MADQLLSEKFMNELGMFVSDFIVDNCERERASDFVLPDDLRKDVVEVLGWVDREYLNKREGFEKVQRVKRGLGL